MKTELPTDPAELRELLLAERARREQAETQLSDRHALSRIPELNPNPVLRVSATGQLLYANPAAGLMARELESTGPSRLRPLLVQAATSALRKGAVQQREIMASGQHFLLSAVPMMEDHYVMLYLTDITAQRHAEESLRQQFSFYESIMAHLPAVVTVLDADQRYRYVNAYAEPDPAQRQARVGLTFADIAPPRACPPHWPPAATASSSGPCTPAPSCTGKSAGPAPTPTRTTTGCATTSRYSGPMRSCNR